MSTTFAVSNVDPSTDGVATTGLRDALERVLGSTVEACSATSWQAAVAPHGFHVLMETLHRAYDKHRCVALSPDNIWLTISQGFAACINQDPARYRSAFVSIESKKEIRIRRDEFVMGNPDNDWARCFPEFSARIREHIGDEMHRLILSDFSTTGDLERAASEVVLMDAVQNYFKYVVQTRCGIRAITLEGTVEDWENVLSKTKGLARFEGLEWWLDKVVPVVEQFVKAAKGEVELSFWEHLYKGKRGSGGITADGHILALLPYTEGRRGNPVKNRFVTDGYGLSVSELPQALSCVPFIWDYYGKGHDYQYLAGHIGIAYDEENDTLRPLVGWAVRPKPSTVKCRD